MEQRLQRVLAAAGVASRRKAEEWITGGRVKVNGETVTAQGTNVDLDRDEITVDGQKISVASKRHYIALHKPIGYVSTVSDPHADKKVVDLVHIDGARLVPVGRLDADSEGLLLMSDDGDFVFKVTHPSQSMGKTYIATVKGRPDVGAMDRLSRGLKLSDGYVTAPAGAKLLAKGREPGTSILELILHEGKYRQVRRMLDTIGHPVLRLVRTRVGPVMLGDLQPGEWRPLTQNELRLIEEGKNAPDTEPEEETRRGQRGHYEGDRREPQRERSFAPADRRPQGSSGRSAPRPTGRPTGDRPQYGGSRPSGGGNDRPSFPSDRPQFGNRPSGGNGRPSFGGDRPSFGGDRRSQGPPRDGASGDRRFSGPPRDGDDRRFSGPPRDGGERRFSGPPPRRPMGPGQGDGNDRPRFGGDRPQSGNDRPRFGGDRSQGQNDRPRFGGGSDRPAFGGGNRPSFGGNRPPSGGDRPQGGSDRPRFGGDRPQSGDRPRFGGNDRPQGGGGRPGFSGNRPPSGGGDRPSYGGDRPRFGGSGDRPQFGGGRPPQGRSDSGSRPNNSFRGGGDAPRRPFNGGNNGGGRPPYRPEQKPRDGKTR